MKSPGLPILTYHALERGHSPIATDPAWFGATMAALAESGFRTIDLDDWVARGRPALERAFALTFDDGLKSVWNAAEVLARHQFTATVFLVTHHVGGRNDWPGQPAGVPRRSSLEWGEVADLESAGFRVASHTHTHPDLTRVSEQSLDDELRIARAELETRLGRPCRLLAYPYGAASARVERAAARYYNAAFGTQLDYATTAESQFRVARIDAYYLRSKRALELLIKGRLRSRLRVRRALRKVRRAALEFTRHEL
jgi:peptidoglycan/xylan/chitin deacetylase (PgdA/CDA1 family)